MSNSWSYKLTALRNALHGPALRTGGVTGPFSSDLAGYLLPRFCSRVGYLVPRRALGDAMVEGELHTSIHPSIHPSHRQSLRP